MGESKRERGGREGGEKGEGEKEREREKGAKKDRLVLI